jgi:hypothetical protein
MARGRGVAGLLKVCVVAAGWCPLALGCAVGDDIPPQKEAVASTAQAFSPAPGTQPNCNDPSTPHTVVRAIPHRGCTGTGASCYWGKTPTPGVVDPIAHNYEVNLWTHLTRGNGYEYLLKLVSTTEPAEEGQGKGRKYFPDHYFFGTGIEYEPADGLPVNPPYYMVPPAHPVYPTFDAKIPFGPSAADWDTEVTLATGPTWAGPSGGMNPPVDSEFWRCVTVLDVAGNKIDFFVLMDEHDPVGPDW